METSTINPILTEGWEKLKNDIEHEFLPKEFYKEFILIRNLTKPISFYTLYCVVAMDIDELNTTDPITTFYEDLILDHLMSSYFDSSPELYIIFETIRIDKVVSKENYSIPLDKYEEILRMKG